jgi:dipeptidyl aminopeptidase/acylaminoacyl peptidase
MPALSQADILEELARNPEVLDAKLSPQGEYIAVLREVNDKRTVVSFTFPGMKPLSVMDFPGRNEVGNFWWVNDDRLVASVNFKRDQFEDELSWGELYGMNVDGSRGEHLFGLRAQSGAKSGRLTSKRNELGSARILNQLWDDPQRILIHITNWNLSGGTERVVEYAELDVYTGRIVKRKNAPAPDASLLADSAGNVKFSFATDADQNLVIHQKTEDGLDWTVFQRIPYGESGMTPTALMNDGRIIVTLEPDGKPQGLHVLDPANKSTTPLFQHDLVNVAPRSDFNGNVYGVRIDDGKPRFEATDPTHPSAALLQNLKAVFPDRYAGITSTTHDFRLSVVGVIDDNRTPEYYLHDAQTNQLRLLFDSRPWVDDTKLGTTEPVAIKTRDGLTLHGYLTLPTGSSGKNLPLVIVPHGGPHGPRDFWEFGWESFIPAAGYPMLRVNYRGSGGYGTAFEKSGFRKWPNEMQDDLTDSVKWAVEQGIADPERLCIFGWSYGGFSAVMSITREPTLYKCSVAGAGVYDHEEQYRNADFADLTRWGRKYIDKVIGDTREARQAASPITYVDRIQTPLLLIHGEEDLRVPIEHSHKLIEAFRKAGKTPPELIVLENEGHSPQNAKNVETMHRATIAFIEKHIGKP